jgi:Raf kinase inhibitor-like YbhB/YbcL family protein
MAGQPLPESCGRQHGNQPPPLSIEGVPARAKSLALVLDDPDAPSGLFTHWLVWNVSPGVASISGAPAGAVEGKNSFGGLGYDGPEPPSGTHRYFFHLYALDTMLDLPAGSDRPALFQAMKGHLVAKGQTMGTYASGK